MARDVDLSSKEWTDLIFEGKNKEYGAYKLRESSDRRHNMALLWTIVGLCVVGVCVWLYSIYADYRAEQARIEAEKLAQIEQEQMQDLVVDIEEEIPEENEMVQEIEIPEALPEEILNTEKFTEFLVVENDKEIEQVKTDEEIKETETAVGHTDFDQGTDDLNIDREHIDEIIVEEKKPEPPKNQVFESVEQMPQFPGGEGELLKWIGSHIKYPTMAMENNVQGRVVVRFVVTRDGTVGEVQVLRSKDPDLDREAVRVVKSLPKFIPGKMNGQAVNVWYTLPVNFKLQGV